MPISRKTYLPAPFVPTPSFGGIDTPMILRGENMWMRFPRIGAPYAEGYKGHKNLSENIPLKVLAGILSWSSTSKTIIGTGSAFLANLRIGQFVFVNTNPISDTQMFVVEEVISDDSFVATDFPTSTGDSYSNGSYVMPVLFPIGVNRGTAIRGNVVQYPKGHFLGVGDGEFRINGQLLNATLSLSKTPKLALFNPTTGLYTSENVGIVLPGTGPQISVAAVTPATPTQMKAGTYNVRVTAKNTETNGFSNPSAALNSTGVVTIADGQAIRVTFLEAMVSDQNAWDIYSTQFADNSTATIEARFMGPWFLVKTVKDSEIGGRAAGTTYDLSFSDSEIQAASKILTFDNFAPVDSEYVDLINGIPIYFSCLGKGNPSKTTGTSPGPAAVPSKPSNPEAVLLNKTFTTAGGDYIIGEFNAKSRIFVLCQNSLQTVILTTLDIEPIAFRSQWSTGFRNPYNVAFYKDYLWAFSNQGMVRSNVNSEDFEDDFASDMAEFVKNIDTGKMLAQYCPKNKAMCFFHSAAERRNGYWVTVVYPFLVHKGVWNPPIVISKTNQDMIVSGVATIGNNLVFLAGGRSNTGVISVGTYIFDGGDSESREWHLGWNYSNDDTDSYTKRLKSFSLIGRFINGAVLKVYGTGPDGNFDLDGFEDGSSENSSHSIGDTVDAIRVNSYNFSDTTPYTHYALRLEGVHTGSNVDRLDKLDVKVEINSSEV